MEEQLGLAGMAAMPPTDEQTLQQIVEMLLDGADPQELIDQGIPAELVQAAVEMIMSQSPQGAAPTAPVSTAGAEMAASAGLASTGLR